MIPHANAIYYHVLSQSKEFSIALDRTGGPQVVLAVPTALRSKVKVHGLRMFQHQRPVLLLIQARRVSVAISGGVWEGRGNRGRVLAGGLSMKRRRRGRIVMLAEPVSKRTE
jgi:hypothetical protein